VSRSFDAIPRKSIGWTTRSRTELAVGTTSVPAGADKWSTTELLGGSLGALSGPTVRLSLTALALSTVFVASSQQEPARPDAEVLRVVLERAAKGENVPQAELEPRTASKDEDLRVAADRIIPRSIVASCLIAKRRALRRPTVQSHLRLVWESAAVIKKEFRTSDQWIRRHPAEAGVLQLSVPVYSDDHLLAGVYVSRLGNNLGGAGVFFMLTAYVTGDRSFPSTH
jgi:hypothetical protein